MSEKRKVSPSSGSQLPLGPDFDELDEVVDAIDVQRGKEVEDAQILQRLARRERSKAD